MKIDPASLNVRDSHHLITGAIVPRPIAWISTVDLRGIYNLAPFSAYCMISTKPFVVGFGVVAKRDGQKKDTLRNVEATGEFVINVVEERMAETMNLTATPFPSDVSEFKEANLTPAKADLVKAPLLAESPVNMECRVLRILEFGAAPAMTWFVIGEVLKVHVKDELWVNGEIQMSGLKAIGRMGGDLYCRTTDVFEMKRPRWAPDEGQPGPADAPRS